MIAIERATVIAEVAAAAKKQLVIVETGGHRVRAVNYLSLTRSLEPGDEVLLNRTATRLGLGTGGVDFVIQPLSGFERELQDPGHILKLRYTPQQLKVLAVEERASPHHRTMKEAAELAGSPVVAASLHSQIIPAAAGAREIDSDLRIVYIMTDGGALPLAFSRTVAAMKRSGWLTGTITCGHAFGGDLEAVNLYSALLAAHHVFGADLIVSSLGPGHCGTGTRFGFSGLQQGQVVNAVSRLGGMPVFLARASSADLRPRHRGLSHHTRTILKSVVWPDVSVPLPGDSEGNRLEAQARDQLGRRHRWPRIDPALLQCALEDCSAAGFQLETMGRGLDDDGIFFRTAAAAGVFAARLAAEKTGEERNVNGSEKPLERQRIYDGRVVRLFLDTVRLPDGGRAEREVVEHGGAVAVVARPADSNLLVLVEQYRHSIGRSLLEIPAGRLEPGEDPLEAARRELREETGYFGGRWTQMMRFFTTPGFSDEEMVLYFADGVEPGDPSPDEGEFLDVRCLPVAKVLDKAESGAFLDAKSIIGILALANRLEQGGGDGK